jgi:hypothetical protein
MVDERDPREPRNLPSELVAVWRKHQKLADKYEMEHAYYGYGDKYYNLQKKHERVCDVLNQAEARQRDNARLRDLIDRIQKLPCDADESGSYFHVAEAVRRLRSDLAAGIV